MWQCVGLVLRDDAGGDGVGVLGLAQVVFLEEALERVVCGHNLVLQRDKTLQQGLRAGRTTGDVHIHRYNLIDTLQHGIAAEHTAGAGAGAAGNAPLRRGHLVPDAAHQCGHLVGDGAADEHEVCLAGGVAVHFCTETRNVVAGAGSRHVFNGAAGGAHGHRPHGVLVHPVDCCFDRGVDETAVGIRVAHEICLEFLKVIAGHNDTCGGVAPPRSH